MTRPRTCHLIWSIQPLTPDGKIRSMFERLVES